MQASRSWRSRSSRCSHPGGKRLVRSGLASCPLLCSAMIRGRWLTRTREQVRSDADGSVSTPVREGWTQSLYLQQELPPNASPNFRSGLERAECQAQCPLCREAAQSRQSASGHFPPAGCFAPHPGHSRGSTVFPKADVCSGSGSEGCPWRHQLSIFEHWLIGTA